jgi:GNAT superfamily N-acetyltransferase
MTVMYAWRGGVTSTELNELHADAFQTRLYTDDGWDWVAQLDGHSLGWVTAREDGALLGFVNVVWDGLVHAWIQDTMVATTARRRGIATALVARAVEESRAAGCEWLHVDFEDHLRSFYLEACGFEPTNAGLIRL